MPGTLYLCATPIGNLEDMTFRCVRILKEVSLIAAEDTRGSIKLLNHFGIKTPMTSYHEYNRIEKGRKLVERLLGGEDVALITDAGMPGISDPGEELVRMSLKQGWHEESKGMQVSHTLLSAIFWAAPRTSSTDSGLFTKTSVIIV